MQKRADRVRVIPLESVLRLAGAQPDPHDPHKWHTSEGTLSVTGTKFMNWTRGSGGGGAIDLAMHLHRRGFIHSLEWLERHFTAPASLPCLQPSGPLELKLPVPTPRHLWRVQHYLAVDRRIPLSLIAPLIDAGLIYADPRANAVFLLLNHKNQPVGAELRGTTSRPWRGMAPGSKKDQGFFSIGPPSSTSIILCESAIDAISCFALHPDHRCLSTAGARPQPLWLSTFIDQACRIYCGFDADPTGNAMAEAMIALYPSVQRLRPSQKDWNDALNSKQSSAR